MNRLILVVIGLIFMLPNLSHATLIKPTISATAGVFTNDMNLINDGIVPSELTGWRADTNVYWNGTAPTFTLDFGDLYHLNDVLLSVDNNDDLAITWSNDLLSWSNLFTIRSSYGEVTWRMGGMDTYSTDSFHSEYVNEIDFSPVQARYLRIQATGGDNSYAIGEFQAFGSKVASVPEPSTLAIFALGIIGLASRLFK